MSGGSCYTIDAEIENLLETDPIAAHERIMQMTRPQPVIVYKEYTGRQPFDDNNNGNGNGNEPPPFTDEQIDIVAAAMAELRIYLRDEFQDALDAAMAPWTEAVAVLQAQMNIVLSLIANNNNNGNGNNAKSIEASEIRTTRRVRVRRSESVS